MSHVMYITRTHMSHTHTPHKGLFHTPQKGLLHTHAKCHLPNGLFQRNFAKVIYRRYDFNG